MNTCCNCIDILDLPLFKEHSNIIAGTNHLERSVRWVYLLETLPEFNDILKWLKGDELLFVTGLYIKNDESKLLRLIDDSISAKIAALVIFIDGPYITSIPQKVIDQANLVGLPIITLPWHIKYLDAHEIICHFISKRTTFSINVANYLQTILFTRIKDEKPLLKQGILYGIDLTKPFNVLVLSLTYTKSSLTDDTKLTDFLQEHINDFIQTNNLNAHLLYHQDYMIIVFEILSTSFVNNLLTFLEENFTSYYPQVKFTTGMGCGANTLSGLQRCLNEAKQVIHLKEHTGTLLHHICSYQELGFYKLFTLPNSTQTFESIYQDTIEPLVQSDRLKDTEFVETLSAFFRCNLNIVQTADTLFIHRNTMRYRIKKIEELTGYDLNNFSHCHLLQTGLIIYGVLVNKATSKRF